MQDSTHIQLPASSACRAATQVVARLRQAGFSAYLVGGCVRDLVLGLVPKDYDIATQARPAQVKRLFRQVIEVGIAFGVVRVRVDGDDGGRHEVEVATFRADGEYLDGRRPDSVRFTDAREDVLRRDFTINGLLLDPTAGPEQGLVVDWVEGLEDLRARRLRAIGEPRLRFGEDALRLLRAPRFAARFGLKVETDTAAAIGQLAPTLTKVAVERVTAELAAMLTASDAPRALALLVELGLAQVLWPSLCAADPQLAGASNRAVALAAQADAAVAPQTLLPVPLILAVTSLGASIPRWIESPEFERSFRISKTDRQGLEATTALIAKRGDLGLARPGPWLAREARWLRHPQAGLALRALAVSERHEPWQDWRAALALAQPSWLWPAAGVTGEVLKRWGHKPGPRFKDALAAAEDALLEGGDLALAERAARRVLAAQLGAQGSD